MSLDIVEIGVDQMTDHVNFEKLATEVLYNEGFHDIAPLTGGSDLAQDATQESFFEHTGKQKIVFQYTIQEYLKGKVHKTIERLIDAKVEFDELVIVTKRHVSGETKIAMIQEVRAKYSKPLQIIDKSTIVLRLADYTNGIFNRNFPNIENQVKDLRSNPGSITNISDSLELSLLKVSMLFTFNTSATKVRKDLFDNYVLGIMYEDQRETLKIDEIVALCKEKTKRIDIEKAQITAVVGRLKSRKLVTITKSLEDVSISKRAEAEIEGGMVKIEEYTASFLSDFLDQILAISKRTFSNQDKERIKKNTKNALISVFELYGLEISQHFLDTKTSVKGVVIEKKDEIIEKAKYKLPSDIGELIIAQLAEIFKSPNKEQSLIIGNWVKSFLGMKLMSIDPLLQEFQATQFAKKVFILDTDFILNAIVQERPESGFYVRIIKSLIEFRCTLIIPKSVISECVNHIVLSFKGNHSLGRSILSYNEETLEATVRNVFLRGFYYHIKNGTGKGTFHSYIQNYYEKSNPEGFFSELIKTQFPKGVQIRSLDDFKVTIPPEQFEKLKTELIENKGKVEKAGRRTTEQIEDLAMTDAKLFLTTYHLDLAGIRDEKKLFGGNAYLLTGSTKYTRCASQLGLKDNVTASPSALAAIMEVIGKVDLNNMDYIQMFDNPLLVYAVDQIQDDIHALVKGGVIITDKKLTRLRWDIQERLHDTIINYKNAEKVADTVGDEKDDEAINAYATMIKVSKELGYKSIPLASGLLDLIEDNKGELEKTKDELSTALEEYKILQSEYTRFGRRKQHYLKKIGKLPGEEPNKKRH